MLTPAPPTSGTPFLTLPSGCVPAGQVSTLTVDSYASSNATATSKTPVAATGCKNVPFNPSLTLTPSTTQSDAPAGLNVDLHVDRGAASSHSGDFSPSGLAASTLQSAVVTLPPGMTLDPSAANGLSACSPSQFGQGSNAAPTCPAASQVGTAEIDTPLLAAPLSGNVYLGCDGSGATPCPVASGLAYLYVYATNATSGVTQKLVGVVTADPGTGQLTTTFSGQPQIPFTDFKLNFKSGPNAPLANPLDCGTATATSSLTPYSGNAAATPSGAFTVDADGTGGACPQTTPFTPSIAGLGATTKAGAFDSPLFLVISRTQGQQYLKQLVVNLPPGLLGEIGSVPLCAEPAATNGTCPATSSLGGVAVVAGSGTDPLNVIGQLYLTGPYNGAPFGLSIVVPAIAGPFNLGTVIVRAGLGIDRNDAHVVVVSDALPQVVGGIPLRYQAIGIAVTRSNFLFNPTSCSPLSIGAGVLSVQGASAVPTTPFQATGCSSLAFGPGLHVSLLGNQQTGAGGHPSLVATVTSGAGQANLKSAAVTLPAGLSVDLASAQNRVCPTAQSQSDTCPDSTIVGSAKIVTPLLGQPLSGPVYFVQGTGSSPLPSLLVTLRGQVALDLRSTTAINSAGRLVTTFTPIPDAPLSSFTLSLNGGPGGILVEGAGGLCSRAQTVNAAFAAQSGKTEQVAVAAATPCGKQARIVRTSVVHRMLRVVVAVPGRGRLTGGGTGLRAVRRNVSGAGRVTLTLKLNKAAAARLAKHRSLKLAAVIRYTPSGAATQTLRTRKLTIRR